jgi:hypothetical protein
MPFSMAMLNNQMVYNILYYVSRDIMTNLRLVMFGSSYFRSTCSGRIQVANPVLVV